MTDPVHVVIDATCLGGPPGRGIATYTARLVDCLAVIPGLQLDALAFPRTQLPPLVKRLPVGAFFHDRRLGHWELQTRHAVDRRIGQGDLFHNPHPHAPLRRPDRWVQTLHDVIPLVISDPSLHSVRRRFLRFGTRYRQATAVIAVSHHAADEGIRLLGLDSTRVHVVHHGVDPAFKPGREPDREQPYLSMVGEYSPRKGLIEAIAVIDQLAADGYPHRLRVAGRVPGELHPLLNDALGKARHPERVEIEGYVGDLVEFYQKAMVHLALSRYEGFGLPALEAMACGTPVVAFANTAQSEILDGGAMMTPDGDIGAVTDAVKRILDSEGKRVELLQAGLEHVRRFDWHQAALHHRDIYKDVARV